MKDFYISSRWLRLCRVPALAAFVAAAVGSGFCVSMIGCLIRLVYLRFPV